MRSQGRNAAPKTKRGRQEDYREPQLTGAETQEQKPPQDLLLLLSILFEKIFQHNLGAGITVLRMVYSFPTLNFLQLQIWLLLMVVGPVP